MWQTCARSWDKRHWGNENYQQFTTLGLKNSQFQCMSQLADTKTLAYR